jgi:hypothetical protein
MHDDVAVDAAFDEQIFAAFELTGDDESAADTGVVGHEMVSISDLPHPPYIP